MSTDLNLHTRISAKFVMEGDIPSERQESLDALNKHTEDICESLQPIFQQLIIEMLELKRKTFSQGG